MFSTKRPLRLAFAPLCALASIAVACGSSGAAPDADSSSTTTGGAPRDAGAGLQADGAGRGGGDVGGDASADASPAPSLPDGGEPNVLPITVNGALCLAQQYLNINEPCTSVTICAPGTKTCQTIDGILLDTGSTGLRLFSSVVTLSLPTLKSSAGGTLAECESYSGGAADWGPLAQVDVVLGEEPPVTTSVQLIDSTFSSPPGPDCDPAAGAQLDTDPRTAGFNGILGISHHATDCGSSCETDPSNGTYYSCTSTTCTGTTSSVQLENPIGLLPGDGNGYVVDLPSVPAAGLPALNGRLVLGIGTRSNNVPGAVSVFPTATFGTIFSDFSSSPINSGTLDTGSSKLYLPYVPEVPVCGSADGGASSSSGLLCPSPSATLSATMVSGSATKTITFEVDDADRILAATDNHVFPGYAQAVDDSDPYFMWGLPFFFGRSVYVAIDGKSTSLGTGPFWAY